MSESPSNARYRNGCFCRNCGRWFTERTWSGLCLSCKGWTQLCVLVAAVVFALGVAVGAIW